MGLSVHHLLDVDSLSAEDVDLILETARELRSRFSRTPRKEDLLRGLSIINVFFEPSTRTRTSFELAAKRLGADTINFSASGSSVAKGESVRDTVQTLLSMEPDLLVVRHARAGAARYVAGIAEEVPVINAGDGMHEHPTQALLDLLTILDHRPELKGCRVVIAGDLAHSRVARSNIRLLGRLGADVTVCAPPTLTPCGIENLGAAVEFDFDRALEGADVVMCLRTQRERQQETFFPTNREYFDFFGLDRKRLALAAENVMVMHPGPVNRGMELAPDVMDGAKSLILEQVNNGVAVRMALLCLLTHVEL